jgi:hypothetical protein
MLKNKLTQNNSKAQGTVEYLVIIAVVVVIAIAVVSLMLTVIEPSQNLDEEQSKIKWQAKELAVIDSLADPNGQGKLVLKNNTFDVITLDSVELDGTTVLAEGGNGKLMAKSSIYSFDFSGVNACTGNAKEYTLKINYTTQVGLDKSTGTDTIVVPCTNDYVSISTGSSFLFSGTNVTGMFPVWNGSTYAPSGSTNSGITIDLDTNALCFGGTNCDANILVNSGDIIFSE